MAARRAVQTFARDRGEHFAALVAHQIDVGRRRRRRRTASSCHHHRTNGRQMMMTVLVKLVRWLSRKAGTDHWHGLTRCVGHLGRYGQVALVGSHSCVAAVAHARQMLMTHARCGAAGHAMMVGGRDHDVLLAGDRVHGGCCGGRERRGRGRGQIGRLTNVFVRLRLMMTR